MSKMIHFILLISVAALTQSSATTFTISTSGGSSCGSKVEGCAARKVPAPSAEEIQLIRESWPAIKNNKKVLSQLVLEHFRVHPKTQELLPELASIPMAKLPSNEYFIKLSETYIVMGMNEIIDNLDNAGVLTVLLECLHPEWFVDYMDVDRQLKETLRIFHKVLESEMGAQLSEATKAAWVKGMDYANTFYKMRQHSDVSSLLSSQEIAAVRNLHAAHRDNIAIPIKALTLMFSEHPESQKLAPSVANVAVDQLSTNQEFLVLAHTCAAVGDFIVSNLDNEKLLTHILQQQSKPEMFVSYIGAIDQLDEMAHVILTAIEEIAHPDAATTSALKKVMNYVNGIIAAKIAPNAADSSSTSIVTRQEKSLIRSTLDQLMFNSQVAPKILLKLFSAEPQMQQLFERLSHVPTSQLMKNKDFLALSYSGASAMNFVVNNMEDSDLVVAQLAKMAESNVFGHGFPAFAFSQPQTFSRVVMAVFQEELGSSFTKEAASAWTSLFNFVSHRLDKEFDASPITDEEHSVFADNIKMVKNLNANFGSKALLKLFVAHPKTMSLFPQFANADVATLADDPEFQAFGKVLMAGFEFLVTHLKEPATLRRVLSNRPFQDYFVSYVSISQQLAETGRLVIEALDEELGSRFIPSTRKAWHRGFRFANTILEQAFH